MALPPPSPVPFLTTTRLALRGHAAADFEAAAALWANPIVVRYISGTSSTEQQTWARLLNYAGHWALMGFGYWALIETASGRYVGDVGFADFKRAVEPSIRGLPELGWVLSPSVHGRGYATEAVEAALAWATRSLSAARAVCMIDPANAPSLRVAAKVGFKEYARTSYAGSPTIMFERPLR